MSPRDRHLESNCVISSGRSTVLEGSVGTLRGTGASDAVMLLLLLLRPDPRAKELSSSSATSLDRFFVTLLTQSRRG